MRMQKAGKLNQLQHLLPDGLLVDAQWLEARGYSRALRSKYVASGWLEQPARGVFTRPGGIERWEQVVVSLQSLLRLPVAVGGRTALGLQGYEHYLPLGEQGNVHLFSETAVPGWLSKLSLGRPFKVHNASRLFPGCCIADGVASLPDPSSRALRDSPTMLPNGLTTVPWGQHTWPLLVSTAERAILELLDELPKHETFESVDVIMEGLQTLSPRRLQALLEVCSSVKVTRLFLWFAERHGHPWRKHVDETKVRLGSGKRVIATGGRLDRRYQITVPEALHAGD